ncbi:ABC transporter permease [Kitasatospora herbaricolor]|uniref:sugar ABC transporter permease n=1 Tax=Kitasatospora herbaricolor TaxID=68217 RepID=UPI00174BED2A|nr:carbohydrate ABC transporter permease [Kitasatospora herbaricolor]MDQ0307302.1 arabinogalactan oligomer/maltooligosaccharide transport system permease protein [Kitasatospora herbaricolor]GGV30846.1 ABC transporter permease [Kitasatospora herbaricolor]
MSTTTERPTITVPGSGIPKARPVKTRRRGEPSPLGKALSHGALILASLIALFPVLWIVFISLGPDKTDYLHPGAILDKMTTSNYSTVLFDTDFFTWFGNAALVSGVTTVVGVLIAATTGYAVSRMRFPGHRPLMWSLLVTQMFPIAVLIVPMYTILSTLGLLDSYLGLILVYSTTTVPYCAWLLKGYFDTIPVEIDEAGRVDGLNPFGTFWRLVLPLARPGLAVAAFYSFLTAWAEVAFASTFMLSSDKYTLAVGLQTFVSEHDAQWNLMAATAVLIAIPSSLLFYLVQRHLVTGLTAGASKS